MKSLRRMIPFLKAYRWIVFWGLVTTVFPVAMELVVPRLLQYVIDQGIRAGDMSIIIRGSVIMLITALIGALATVGQGYCRAHLSQGLAYDLRNVLFKHIQALSFANLDQIQTGRLMTRLSSDVDVVRMFSSAGISLLLRALLMIFGSLIMIMLTDLQLSLVMFAVLIGAGLVVRMIFTIAKPLFTVVQQKLSNLNMAVQENLAGVQVVKAFVRERFEINRFEDYNLDFVSANIKVGRLVAVAMPVLTLLTNVGLVGLVWFGGLDVINSRLTLGELIAFNNYLMIGMMPLLLLSNMLTMVSRAEASAARVFEVIDTEPSIKKADEPYRAPLKGKVVFEDVSFRYARRDEHSSADWGQVEVANNGHNGHGNGLGSQEVLDHASFVVEPGQQIALLGATGSGKSTLVNLIPRFYDVTGGRVMIDDVDVRQWEPASLRSQVGMVMQQTLLFGGTIQENIAYGKSGATLDEVIAAAKAAQAHEFITTMPEGYDSLIEERGSNLSGGQRQRIAIARALLIRPGILIMDDSTSAVDMETEFKIQEALDELMANRTTFIIAQRISSVIKADQIFILDSGQIVDQGTHRELLQTSPIYQEIYESQLGERALHGTNGTNDTGPHRLPSAGEEITERRV